MDQELAFKLQADGISYQTQVEIPVTTAAFYFPLETRPLLVFVDGPVHLGKSQRVKDEELRCLLRKRGYRVLELSYTSYSDRKGDELYQEILDALGKDIQAGGYSNSIWTDAAVSGQQNHRQPSLLRQSLDL